MQKPVFPTVLVVIVTFNRAEYLRQCLTAIAAQTVAVQKILVVNNCSTDHTSEVLQQLAAAGMPVTEHRTGENLGGAGGFAVAFELAKQERADWVWVMDDDVSPEPECLERLLAASDGYAVVQPNRYHDDYEFLEIYRQVNMRNPFDSMFKSRWRTPNAGPRDDVDIEFFPFEGPLIQKPMLDRLALPCAEYFLFCDDVEYGIRVRRAGGRIRLCGRALMKRLIRPVVTDRNFTWRNYFEFRNRVWMDRAHGGEVFAWTRGLLWMCWQLLSCARQNRDRMSYRIVGAGTWDGLMGRRQALVAVQRKFAR